jgi:flavin-dependent dehydrogenase
MDRRKFDSWLLSMVPSNVDIRTNCRFKGYSTENGFFKLKLLQGDQIYIEKTRILIGADGASSKVRSQASPRSLLPHKYIAVQEWVESSEKLPYFISIFDRKITDFYCWAIPKGDYLLIGAALQPKKNTNAKFRLLKEILRNNGFQFGKTVWREGAHILRPMKTKQLLTGRDRIAFLGEAAGWISPSSAEGISYAFRSACALAEALQETPEGFEQRYQKKTVRLKRNIFLKIMKSHFIFNPTLRKIVMKSGVQSVKLYRPERLG